VKLLVLTPEPIDEGDRDYREDEGLSDAESRFGVPVTHALISH
jgi:hypothetical protein